MRRGELVLLDTNVLLSATNTARADHAASRRVFSRALELGVHAATCGQILREYLVVATRPVSVNGLGLKTSEALKNVSWFNARLVFFEETEAAHRELRALIESSGVSGKRIHDANIAAVMRCGGIRRIVTNNPEDFRFFPGIDVSTPAEFAGE